MWKVKGFSSQALPGSTIVVSCSQTAISPPYLYGDADRVTSPYKYGGEIAVWLRETTAIVVRDRKDLFAVCMVVSRRVTRLRTTRQQDYETVRLRDSKTTGQQDYETARQWDSRTTRQQDYGTARLRDNRTTRQQDYGTAGLRDSKTTRQQDHGTQKTGPIAILLESLVVYLI